MMRLSVRLVSAALLASACADVDPGGVPVTPEDAVVVSDSTSCSTCRIHIDTLLTIAGSDSAPFFASTRLTWIPEAGFVAAAPLADQGVVALFDESGGFVRRLLGDGDGPMEMRRIRFAVAQGDTTLLLVGTDGRTRRVALLTGEVEPSHLPRNFLPYELVNGPGGRLLASAVSPAHSNVAVLSKDLVIVRSFGERLGTGSDHVGTHPIALESRLGAGSSDVIAQARRKLSPDVTLWSLDGVPLRRLTRESAWFPRYTPSEYQEVSALLPSQARVKPEIVAVWPDTGTLVWLVGRIPDRRWRQADAIDAPPKVSAMGIPVLPEHDWSKFLDTVIEVIDWRVGKVVARSIIDTYAYRMAAEGILEVPGLAADFSETRTLVRPRLVITER